MRPTLQRSLLVSLLALGSLSCEASNAVLDVQMGLPANPLGEPMFVRVLVARGDFPVPENAWVPEAHELTSGTSTYQFSIEDPNLACDPESPGDCDVLLEVRFCLDRECASLRTGTPEIRAIDPQAVIRYRLERPLFVGQRTRWEPTITAVPECTDEPASCSSVVPPPDELSGCVVDSSVSSGPPTWFCDVLSCNEIVCADDPGGAGGQCEGGRTGPHLCDR